MSNSDTVYLITTRKADAAIFENPSSSIDLFADETFWTFFISNAGPLNAIIDMVGEWKKTEDNNYEDLSEKLDLVKAGTFEGNIEELKRAIIACALDTHYGKAQSADEIAKRQSDIEATTALFGTIRKLDGTQVYITHNWYTKAPLNFSKSGSKHIFLEKLIQIIINDHKDKQNVEVKLFAHDKDIFDRSVKDSVVTTDLLYADYSDLLNHNFCHESVADSAKESLKTTDHLSVNNGDKEDKNSLLNMINTGRVYVFQHNNHSMFLKHILNSQSIKGSEKEFIEGLESFLSITGNFASIRMIKANAHNSASMKNIIHIHLDFSSGLECQFPSFFNQLVAFNHHAWKQHRRFIPEIFNRLLTDSNTAPSSKKDKKTPSIEDITSSPILITADKALKSDDNNDLIHLDARARYFDSSIWLRFMKLNICRTITEKEINDIFPHDFSVYKTANAREIREFNARLCINSRIQDFISGHGKHITPFPFSSETSNYEKANSQWEILIKKINIKKFKIRILLIDDKATQQNGLQSINKLDVLKNVLKEKFDVRDEPNTVTHDTETENDKPIIYIDYVCSVSDVYDKIQAKKYDILFLDYLFEDDDKKPQYGTSLLQEIIDNKDKDAKWYEKRGPLKMFWIYFISAFSTAIREDMRVNNMHYSEKYWHIARGACPSNTPGLFLANFYYLLNRQIEELTDLAISHKLSRDDKWIVTVIDFLHDLFSIKDEVKHRAMRNFNSFLQLRSHYEALYLDYYFEKDIVTSEQQGSLLVQSLFPDIQFYGVTFWGHLQHLIYLIAFGNIGQWDILWDEYKCIEIELDEADRLFTKSTNDESIKSKIKEYIFDLRKQNQNY